MKDYIFLSKPWIDYVIKEIPLDSLKKIGQRIGIKSELLPSLIAPSDELLVESYGTKAAIIEEFFKTYKQAGSISQGREYIIDSLPLRFAILWDYVAKVSYFGNNSTHSLALIGSPDGFTISVDEIEENESIEYYLMRIFCNKADHPDFPEQAMLPNTDLNIFLPVVCKAIDKLPTPTTNLHFLAKKLYFKEKGKKSFTVAIPIAAARLKEKD